jgi:16S rRNA processing protein RimM
MRALPRRRASAVWLGDDRFGLVGTRAVEGAWLVRVDGVGDRDRAEALKGRSVRVARDELGLAPGEFLLVELVGCRAFLRDGTPWGEIVALEPDAQDRLVIRDGGVDRLLPAVAAFLLEVDLAAGRVVVDPPEGLPEEPLPCASRS